MATTPDTPVPRPAVRNNGWIWYFVLLGVMTLAATIILVVYNLQQQLKPEQLERARADWEAKGPKSYRLVYTVKINELNSTNHCEVLVRNGRAIRVQVNDELLPATQLSYYGMHRILGDINANLEKDQDKGRPRTYTRAIFDPANGALRWYVRRVMGGKERVEITIEKLEPEP